MHPALLVLIFTLPAVLAATVGGAIAVRRPPSPPVTAAIQHFAAGIVFAAVALELLPKERTEAAIPVVVGFALGIVLMVGLRVLERRIEASEKPSGFPTGLLLITGLDLAIDGVVLGIAFAAGEQSGILLAIALILEVLFLALSVTTAVVAAGSRRWVALATAPGLAMIMCAAAVAGRVFLGALPPFPFAVLLGVGIVAMLYLVTEELLVEAHEVQETHWSVAAFFLGFLLFLVIEMMVEN